MRVYHEPTMTKLHRAVTDPLFKSTRDQLDEYNSVDVQIHDVVAQADSLEWDLDLADMWLTSARWTTMIRQYVNPEQFLMWLDTSATRVGTNNRGIAMLRTNTVEPKRQSNGKVTRRWGSCMLAISYKALPHPQITLHSRTTYLGYIGALDLSVAQTCGRYVAEALDLQESDIRFVWMNEATQWHGFKSLAYLFAYAPKAAALCERRELTPREERFVESRPGLLIARKWLQKVRREYEDEGRMYGDEKYNTFLRIVRRYHTQVHGHEYAKQFESLSVNATEDGKIKKAYGLLPSCKISTLDFRKLDGVPPLIGDPLDQPLLPGDLFDHDEDEEDDDE